jgi:hypothetical protein
LYVPSGHHFVMMKHIQQLTAEEVNILQHNTATDITSLNEEVNLHLHQDVNMLLQLHESHML